MHLGFFEQLLIMLSASVVLLTAFHRLRIPALLAFLLVGVAAGPKGLALVPDINDLQALAELGLVFLLFMLGLEFSLPRLLAMRNMVFRIGGAQVLVCTAAFTGFFMLYGLQWQAAFVLAGGFALSSTAIVSKELQQIAQLHTRHGQIAIGVLLFQDIVAVGLLIAVPILASQQTAFTPADLGEALLKGGLLLSVMLLAGRYVLPRLLSETAATRSDELLVMTSLVIALLAGWFTHWLGLSMELGAFLAGMALGESHFRHQLEADTRPFRDLLLGLFFISIGMLVDVGMIREYWHRILFFGALLIAFKAGLIALLARALGESWRAAIPAAIALAQGGEFLFALLALAARERLIPVDVASFALSVAVISMAATPPLIGAALRITDWVLRQRDKPAGAETDNQTLATAVACLDRQHVLVCGFGRVGQTVARFLKQVSVPYVALETDTIRISEASAAGEPIFYGDPCRKDILKLAGLDHASLLVISFDNPAAAIRIIQHARERRPDIPILVRARDDSHLPQLLEAGATEVIPETLEASLTLVSHMLVLLGIPQERIEHMTDQVRHDRYSLLHGFFPGGKLNLGTRRGRDAEVVHAVALPDHARAIGRRLDAFAFNTLAVVVSEIHRHDGERLQNPDDATLFMAGDTVILKGRAGDLEAAEDLLLGG